MRCLIVGAGVAGPSLAHWLLQAGHTPTLVERAPRLRTGGYVIDFWGRAFDVAERMGVLPDLLQRGYQVTDVRLVGEDGRSVGGFDAEVFGRFTGGRYTTLPRGDLAEAIYRTIDGKLETLFYDHVVELHDRGDIVEVRLAHGGRRTFDLVIGADGLHSSVRAMAFGPQESFEKYLGYKVAAFEVAGYRPRDPGVYVLHTGVGRQVGRFAMRDDRTLFLFVVADEDPSIPEGPDEKKAFVRNRFATMGWECPAILGAMDAASDVYLDRVSQIRADVWSKGRVALLGDAAYAVSLLAGQGCALAMVGAYVLAGELGDGSDVAGALVRYRARLAPYIAEKQRAAEGFARSFAPRSELALAVRNGLSRLLRVGFVADLALRKAMKDDFALPDYDVQGQVGAI
jgi:2-polyprenyl-6-methoxyphenol hydroxylase-like FAD-dependent oxidoreductase